MLKPIIISAAIIFVYINFAFLESVFVNSRVKLTKNFPKGMFGMIIPLTFLVLPMSVLSLIATFSLQTIYVLRLAVRLAEGFPKDTKIKHTDNFNYYLAFTGNIFCCQGFISFCGHSPPSA
jgi:hypothetical protein